MKGTTKVKSLKEIRLATLVDEREAVTKKHEEILNAVGLTDDKMPTETHRTMIQSYRDHAITLDSDIAELTEDIERDGKASEAAKVARRIAAGNTPGFEANDEGVAYRDFYTYARDVVLTREGRAFSSITGQFSGAEREAARERLSLLERVNNTLTSNLGGLNPPQHIAQIFQVIIKARPLVASALSTTLERGVLTYPKVSTRPVVAVQASEKTSAGDTGMVVDLETAQAKTFLGGGDLSWQQLNWSTPDALTLWFDLAAADYALKTERAAGDVLTDSAFGHILGTQLSATPTYTEFLTAVGAGAAAVYTNSGRQADTLYMSEDRFWYMFGLSSDQFAQFASVGVDAIGPLNIVRSRGMDSGEIVVGDSKGLLVAETPGAPVELRVVEPAIGGLEVGIIGAFVAVAVDDGAFCQITTAS